MKTKKKADAIAVGDTCRVVQSGGGLGPTLWIVDKINDRGDCVIRETGDPRNAGQPFHVSLLRKVT